MICTCGTLIAVITFDAVGIGELLIVLCYKHVMPVGIMTWAPKHPLVITTCNDADRHHISITTIGQYRIDAEGITCYGDDMVMMMNGIFFCQINETYCIRQTLIAVITFDAVGIGVSC